MTPLGKKILIVEDEQSLRMSLQDTFSAEGFEVFAASNGEEGLKLALEKSPDIILLDLLMPKMDGMTMLRKIRSENAWGKNVPVIILTNLTADDEKRMKDITELEPTYYLEKVNWHMKDVVEKVKERLGLLPSQ